MAAFRFVSIFNWVSKFITGGFGDWVYRLVLVGLLLGFLSLRIPLVYGVGGFACFILIMIFPLFLGLLGGRLLGGKLSHFFCQFVPWGTPLELAPFVCWVEMISYLIRPLVLMIRPFVNLTIGSLCGCALSLFTMKYWWVVVFFFVLFFYEIFVAVVHWFIVCNILSFSEDH